MRKFFISILSIAIATTAFAQPRGNGRGGAMPDKSADTTLTQMIKTVLPKFKKFEFVGKNGASLPYNLFVPQNYDKNKQYPLVLFMGDASTAGTDSQRPLTQGWGGLIWATDEEQSKHEAFVLVPGYTAKAVDDDWSTTAEVEMTIDLLDDVCKSYSIDRSSIYTTGQSMGGMMSFYFNITHPHLFAASLFIGSQWDTSKMAPFIGNKFFYVVAEGDEKAPKGMAALEKVLLTHGVVPTKGYWSAKLPEADQADSVKSMLKKGNNINFITFTKGSVLPESGLGNEHMNSFDYGYKLSAVRDWLFEQHLDTTALTLSTNKLIACANDGDWHGDGVTPLMAIKKAIDKGAKMVAFSIKTNGDGALVLASDNDKSGVEVTLHDALSLAKDRIFFGIKNYPEAYKEQIDTEAKLLGMQNEVLYLNAINLDRKDGLKQVKNTLKSNPRFVYLQYSKNDSQLQKAIKLVGDKIPVMVNTSESGLAAQHSDVSMHGNIDQAWGTLRDMGVDIIITNQVKPMMKWIGK